MYSLGSLEMYRLLAPNDSLLRANDNLLPPNVGLPGANDNKPNNMSIQESPNRSKTDYDERIM